MRVSRGERTTWGFAEQRHARAAGFLAPVFDGSRRDGVFSVLQIFLGDRTKRRKRPVSRRHGGRTADCAFTHREDAGSQAAVPVFSTEWRACAFRPGKVSVTGGFDEVARPVLSGRPPTLAISREARWRVLYQPASIVIMNTRHHREELQRRIYPGCAAEELRSFAWKNIHNWGLLTSHFFFSVAAR